MNRRWAMALMGCVLAACGAEDGPIEATQTPTIPPTPTVAAADLKAPEPGEGFQLKSGEIMLNPGDDLTWCTYINGAVDTLTAVNASTGLQKHFGHHIAVYQSDEYYPDGVAPCYDKESGMAGWTLIMGNFDAGYTISYPDDVAIAVHPDKTIIVNTHYIHTGTEPILADDAINLLTVPVDEVAYWLGSYLMVNFDIAVQPGASYVSSATCPIPLDMSVVLQIGHTHIWGSEITIVRTDTQGRATTLYSGPPTVDDPTVQGTVRYFDEPLELKRGDQITWTCTWLNTTDQTLAWPDEMCTVLLTYYPDSGNQLQCPQNVWALDDAARGR